MGYRPASIPRPFRGNLDAAAERPIVESLPRTHPRVVVGLAI